jgi:hypothetical protein
MTIFCIDFPAISKQEMFQAPSYRRFVEFDANERPELRDGEEVLYKLEGVEVAFSKDVKIDFPFELIITNKRILLIGDGDNSPNYDFDVAYISLHAVTVSRKLIQSAVGYLLAHHNT